jgi:hypothetical protein
VIVGGGAAAVVLCGELDVADAAGVAAAGVVAREPEIIADLAGPEFIDYSGVAGLARGRKLARHAGDSAGSWGPACVAVK